MRKTVQLVLAAAMGLNAACAAAAQSCATPDHRAFDFWLGDWTVQTPQGKTPSRSRVSKELGGCVVRERMDIGEGLVGESVSAYDDLRDLWVHTWVDNSGTVLHLEGRMRNGQMVLEGETGFRGRTVFSHRITWTLNADGSVRQRWETMSPKGELRVVFDGRYTRP